MTKTALLITDMQNDFLPGGALGVENGHTIIPDIVDRAKEFPYDAYVFSQDWHPADHLSFDDPARYEDRSWPAHCVQNTKGALLHPAIDELKSWCENRSSVPTVTVLKGQNMDHEAYSPFDEQAEVILNGIPQKYNLATALKGLGIKCVENVGIATDYCVKAGSLDAVKHGFTSSALLSLTMPVAIRTGLQAVADMAQAGVRFE